MTFPANSRQAGLLVVGLLIATTTTACMWFGSSDADCMAEMTAASCDCAYDFYSCLDETGDVDACNTASATCTDGAMVDVAECAEEDGCLDVYLGCNDAAGDAEAAAACTQALESCDDWYDDACVTSCESTLGACLEGTTSDGWIAKQQCVDAACGCMADCY